MVTVTIDEIRAQLEVLGVIYSKLEVRGSDVLVTFEQQSKFPMKEFATIDELRTDIIESLAFLHRMQREAYARFEVAFRQRLDDIERRLREEEREVTDVN